MIWPNCTHPVVVFNRKIEQLLPLVQYFQYGKSHIDYDFTTWSDDFPYKIFNSAIPSLQKLVDNSEFGVIPDTLRSYYAVLDDGQLVDLYVLVPCRKCDFCHYIYSNSFSNRVQFESQSHDEPPYFLLLTYRDKFVSKSINYRDLQTFIKRFRYHLKKLSPSSNLRYVSVGEYGEKYGRPHFHLILWGINWRDFSSVNPLSDVLKQLINYCWRSTCRGVRESFDFYCRQGFKVWDNFKTDDKNSLGFSNLQVCRSSNSCGKYVAKYITKQHLRLRSSKNLGFQFIKSIYRKCDKNTVSFVDRFSGDTVEKNLDSFYLRKLLPTVREFVPVSLQRSIRLLSSYCRYFSKVSKRYRSYYQYYINLFSYNGLNEINTYPSCRWRFFGRAAFDSLAREVHLKFYQLMSLHPLSELYENSAIRQKIIADSDFSLFKTYHDFVSQEPLCLTDNQ